MSSPFTHHSPLLILFLVLPLQILLSLPPSTLAQTLEFSDVTRAVGLSQNGPQFKWGGPCVADLDNDGHYDLILGHHFSSKAQLFFGAGDGTFIQRPFIKRRDVHGIAIGLRRADSSSRLIALSVGGLRGESLKPLNMFEVNGRSTRNVTNSYGLGKGLSRSRNAIFMDLKNRSLAQSVANGGGPDILALGYLGNPNSGLRQYAFENRGGQYIYRRVPFLEDVQRGRTEVTDVNGDGIMEVINVLWLEIYKLAAPFSFRDVTKEVLPKGTGRFRNTVAAVAEIDFDNDGDFDLYVARTRQSLLTKRKDKKGDDLRDVLLENRGGWYYDVSGEAGLVGGSSSMGATVGDFNNDGWADVFVTTWKGERDYVLLNKGNGTFSSVGGLVPKGKDVPGNHATAVDYDQDGRVDIIVGQGGIHSDPGTYQVMRNVMGRGKNHYLLVRVGSSPRLGASSLHAVVVLTVGERRIYKRVGSVGAQYAGGSWLDILHFGVGRVGRVDKVSVRWSDGTRRKMSDVVVDRLVTFGYFPTK